MRKLMSSGKDEEGQNEEGEEFGPGDLFAEEVWECLFNVVCSFQEVKKNRQMGTEMHRRIQSLRKGKKQRRSRRARARKAKGVMATTASRARTQSSTRLRSSLK